MTWRLAKGAEAISVQEQLVDWAKSEHGDDSAGYATQLNNLAGLVQAQGRYEEAERLYCTALEIDRATIGEGHPVIRQAVGRTCVGLSSTALLRK